MKLITLFLKLQTRVVVETRCFKKLIGVILQIFFQETSRSLLLKGKFLHSQIGFRMKWFPNLFSSSEVPFFHLKTSAVKLSIKHLINLALERNPVLQRTKK